MLKVNTNDVESPNGYSFSTLMANSLHPIFHAFAAAKDERELRLRFMDCAADHFGVQRWGIYLLDDQLRLREFDIQGLPDSFVERYEEVGRAVDPVMRYVVERHAPAHEQLMLTAQGWKQSELYQHCCSRYDHEHIMTGPLVGSAHLVGTVHFARTSGTRPFNAEDLADLSAVCTHLSACLAVLWPRSTCYDSSLSKWLTKRELQIAELVAQGLTNAEVSAQLWIQPNSVKQALKRMFRKLNVSSRAEMVAKLQRISG